MYIFARNENIRPQRKKANIPFFCWYSWFIVISNPIPVSSQEKNLRAHDLYSVLIRKQNTEMKYKKVPWGPSIKYVRPKMAISEPPPTPILKNTLWPYPQPNPVQAYSCNSFSKIQWILKNLRIWSEPIHHYKSFHW